MRMGSPLNQKKTLAAQLRLRPFCSAKLAVVGRYLQKGIRAIQIARYEDPAVKLAGIAELIRGAAAPDVSDSHGDHDYAMITVHTIWEELK